MGMDQVLRSPRVDRPHAHISGPDHDSSPPGDPLPEPCPASISKLRGRCAPRVDHSRLARPRVVIRPKLRRLSPDCNGLRLGFGVSARHASFPRPEPDRTEPVVRSTQAPKIPNPIAVAATKAISPRSVNRRRGRCMAETSWQSGSLNQTFDIPVWSRVRLSAPTMDQALRLIAPPLLNSHPAIEPMRARRSVTSRCPTLIDAFHANLYSLRWNSSSALSRHWGIVAAGRAVLMYTVRAVVGRSSIMFADAVDRTKVLVQSIRPGSWL